MDNNLRQLRKNAMSYEFSACDKMVRELFKSLSADQSITIAVAILKQHVSTFERLYPNIQWTHDWLGHLDRREAIDYSSAEFGLYDDVGIFDNRGVKRPGLASFLMSMQLLDSAFRAYLSSQDEVCCVLAGDSIGYTLGAKVSVFWAELNPQAYESYMGNPTVSEAHSPEESEKVEKAAEEYRNNLQVKEFRRALYLMVADLLDNILNGTKTE